MKNTIKTQAALGRAVCFRAHARVFTQAEVRAADEGVV